MSLEQQSLDRYRMGIAPYRLAAARDRRAGRADRRRLGVGPVAHLAAVASTACRSAQKDPQFHKDISFFAFDLPWYRFLLGFGFAAVVSR